MRRTLMFAYGIVSYLVFLVSFCYAVGFLGNFLVPKSIDSGVFSSSLWPALLIDAILLGLFAVQHSIMARPAFKKVWTRIVPKPVERSTFVLLSSLILLLIFWQWQPVNSVIWNVQNSVAAGILWALFAIGWVYAALKRQEHVQPEFTTRLFYSRVRHPIMAGFIVAFWATPYMTIGHLFFAVMTTGYILVGIWFEERDLIRYIGKDYVTYKKEVPALIPTPRHKAHEPATPPATDEV